MTYLDTSAILKRFVSEKGTPYVMHLLRRHSPVATSQVAHTETLSALARLRREGMLDESQYSMVCQAFESEFKRYLVVGTEVTTIASTLSRRQSLHALDLIDLASALYLHERLGSYLCLAGADRRLLAEAAAEGLTVINVEEAAPSAPAAKRLVTARVANAEAPPSPRANRKGSSR